MSFLKKYYLLLISALAFLLAFFFQSFDGPSTIANRYLIDFQKVILEKEEFSNQFIAKFSELSLDANFDDFEQVRKNNDEWIKNETITVFVFDNQNLTYWSDNSFSPSFVSLNELDSQIFFSGNAWYLVTHASKNNRDIFLLLLIKHQYPFENEYLKNEFQKDFTIDNAVEIYDEPCDYAYSIFNSQGDFVLSLSLEKCFSNTFVRGILSLLLLSIGFSLFLLFLIKIQNTNFVFRVVKGIVAIAFGVFLQKWSLSNFVAMGDDVNRLFSGFIVALIFAYFVFSCSTKYKTRYVNYVVFAVGSFMICGTATGFIKSLAFNSDINLELFNLLTTNALSFIAYFVIAFFLFLYFAFCFRYTKDIIFEKKVDNLLFVIACLLLPILFFFIIQYSDFYWYLVVFYLITVLFVLGISRKKYEKLPFVWKMVTLIVSVIYVELAIGIYDGKQQSDERVARAVELANEQDPLAESFLSKVYKSTRNDNTLAQLMQSSNNKDVEVKDYLQKTYFNNFLKNYELECTVCGLDSSFVESNQLQNCDSYFKQILSVSGKSISDTNYYFINNQDGNITYFDSISFNNNDLKLYIELHSKTTSQEYGYPTILLDKDVQTKTVETFSSAKYKNGTLISKRGNCPYPQEFSFDSDGQYYTFTDKQHHIVHLACKVNDQFTVIVSNRLLQWNNYLMWFPYIFMLFFVFLFLFDACIYNVQIDVNRSLSTRIRHSFVALLVGSFLTIGIFSIVFFNARNNRQQRLFLQDKMNAIAHQVSGFYTDYESIGSDETFNMQNILSDLASVHSTDINFYDVNGNLMASSRPEIFQYRLQSEKLATRAYFQLVQQKRPSFSHSESIGNLQFISAYTIVINAQNKTLGYLNLPNFSNQEEYTQQFAGLIVSLLNLFVVLLFVAAILSVFISKKISAPLTILQNKMKNVTVGVDNEKIEINAPDELQGLLENYNTMIDQLSTSAEKLAKAERESAWREMARQIAHEIKNPLTPMKLSIQLLNRSWDEKDEKFEKRLKSISKTMIEQIDSLADTATSFSDFAKLSKVNVELFICNELIENCITLFSQEENITIHNNITSQILVAADKEKLMRVFNNLLKNAIQSIPKDRSGEICIDAQVVEDFSTIIIQDNGRGIDDEIQSRIFELHFTTKSTGSGFGLAICKNIVEACGGSIWFETKIGEGTRFFIKLPNRM